jgi:hypothetical protein
MRYLKDLFRALEMSCQTLDVATIKSHARFDEVQIMLLKLPPLHRPLLSFCISELGKTRAVFAVDLAMGVPQTNSCIFSRCRRKVVQ